MELIANQFADIAAELHRIRQAEQANWKTEAPAEAVPKRDEHIEVAEMMIKLGAEELAKCLRDLPMLYDAMRDVIVRDSMGRSDESVYHACEPIIITFTVQKQGPDWQVLVPPDAEQALAELRQRASRDPIGDVIPSAPSVLPGGDKLRPLFKDRRTWPIRDLVYSSTDEDSGPEDDQVDTEQKMVGDGLITRLRVWRLREAREARIAPYMVVNNTVLRDIAAVRPMTYEALAEIKGMGPAKMRRYGEPILNQIMLHANEMRRVRSSAIVE